MNVDHFTKKITVQMITDEGLLGLEETITTLAEAEGLKAHAESVRRSWSRRPERGRKNLFFIARMSEHLLEMAGALVRVREGKVEVLTDPKIHCCPLRKDLYGIEIESRETVASTLQKHMQELGMYGPKRVLELKDKPVSFGASEILTDALVEGLVDAAVVVCEGAGTIVTARPHVLQAVGAHITGLVKTEPIGEIQDGLVERECLLLDRQGSIDQIQGFEKAVAVGFKKIAVTVAGTRSHDAEALRELGAKLGVRPFILAVHTTGVSEARPRRWQRAATSSGPAPRGR